MIFDFQEINRNVRKHSYRFLGSGSGRQIFDLGNGYVIKIARNRKGLAQNEAEYQIYKSGSNELFAPIVAASPSLNMIIMERANRHSDNSPVWRYFGVNNNYELKQIPQIHSAIKKNGLVFSDLRRPSSWGTINGKPVIIDYGLTRSVHKKYYFGL